MYRFNYKISKRSKKVKNNMKNNWRKEKTEELSKILDLAVVDELKEHEEILLERSESVLECRGGNFMNVSERIKGTNIVPCSRHVTGHNFKKLPLFFHVQHNLDFVRHNFCLLLGIMYLPTYVYDSVYTLFYVSMYLESMYLDLCRSRIWNNHTFFFVFYPL